MAFFLLLYFGAWSGLEYLNYCANPYFVLSLSYPQASQGLNPNGSKFTISEITSDELLGKVLEKEGAIGFTTEELRSILNATPIQMGDTVSLEQPYITTEYQIGLLPTLTMTRVDARLLLQTFAQTYREWFIERYSPKTNILQLDFSGMDEADYLDIIATLDSKAGSMENYMTVCREENASFQAVSTGESFASIEKKIDNYRNIGLESIRAYLLKHGISKNSEQYVGRLNYDNQLLTVNYLKSQASYQIYLDAIQMYERDMATIVLIPTKDLSGEFYMSRTKIGVDNFSRNADKEIVNSKQLSSDMENNTYIISQFRSGIATADHISQAESMISESKEQLMSLSSDALKTFEEYERKIKNGYMTITYPPLKDILFDRLLTVSILLLILLAAIAGCILTEGNHIKKARRNSHEKV